MANTLQDTTNYIVPFCRYQAANIGSSNMPILGIGNIVRNIILAAPFTWRFNRNNAALVGIANPPGIAVGVSDYTQKIPDFGFLEKVSLYDGAQYWEFKDVLNNQALALSSTTARPQTISVFNDDGAGNVTFRLSATPDKANYTINMVYQKAPVSFASLSDGWGPIPDSFSDVYNNMCLGYYMDSCQDPRGPQYIARGVAGLLARAQGLSSTDKAIFAASYLNLNAQQLLEMMKTQQGQQAQEKR